MAKKKTILICQVGNDPRINALKEQLVQKGYTVRYVCVPRVDPKDTAREDEIKALLEGETKDVDVVICLVDETTHTDSLIDWELQRAYEEEIAIIGVYAEGCPPDVALPENLERYRDQLVTWDEEKIVTAVEGRGVASENPDGTPKGPSWNVGKTEC